MQVDEKKTYNCKVKEAELKLVMCLVEHNLPFLLMDHLPTLLTSIAPDSEILKGINCARTKSTKIVENLATESQNSIKASVVNKKYSLIVDETDISVNKCLAVVIRFRANDQIRDCLLGLVKINNGTAAGITQRILDLLRESDIPVENLIGFAGDNCSVMMGNFNGVQAKLKEICPHIFVMGCICHSMHLCASAAALKLPNQIEDFVRDIIIILITVQNDLENISSFWDYWNLNQKSF